MPDCIITGFLSWIEYHSGTAAWVQAAGSIIALVAAIFVPWWTTHNADRLNRRRFLVSIAAIGGEAQECFADAAMKCNASDDEALEFVRSVNAFHRFRIVSAAMQAIPVHQLPNYNLTRCVIELQRMMGEGQMQLDAAFAEISGHGLLVQRVFYATAFSSLASRAHSCLKVIEDAANNTI